MKTATRSASSVRFASKLQGKLEKSNKNLFYSPFSILSALGMCAAGAKNQTESALAKLLEVSANAQERKAEFKALVAEVVGDGKERPYQLVTANALWGQKGIKYHKPFATTVKEDYGGAFVEVDYESDADTAVDRINSWCNENTNGKIPTIIKRDFINEDTRLILTNAIYFKGSWQIEFDKNRTKDLNFHTPTGYKLVPMMQLSDGFAYAEDKDFQALDLPYTGDDLSMMILLPKGDNTEAIDSDLVAAYNKAVDTFQYEDTVHVSLPRFKLETEYKMGKTLKELGAGLAFSDSADFSGITPDEALKISEVIHKAFVEVNEEGTEAAAATAVGMMRCTSVMTPKKPKVFNANRPFVFFIRNRYTGNVLFAGRVTDPTGN